MVRPTNHVIARAGFTLREVPDTLGSFAISSCQIYLKTEKTLKLLRSERGAPAETVPYGKSGTGYYITFIKRLDECLRLQILEQKLLISFGLYI